MAWSTAPPRSPRSAISPSRTGLACTWTAPASPTPSSRPAPARPTSPGGPGVDTLSFGFVKNGGLNAEALILFKTELADEILVRRKRAGHLLSKGRMLAAQILALLENDLWLANARAANAAAQALAKAARRPADLSRRGQRVVPPRHRRGSGAAARAGLRFLRLGPGRDPAGHQLGPGRRGRSTSSPRRSRPCDCRSSAPTLTAVILPFVIFTGDLGLDLDRHPRPIGLGAAAMVGHLPLHHRRRGDGGRGAGQGREAAARRRRAQGDAVPRVSQFFVNFNAVYLAERHITSGLVATVFALLVIPNTLLGWAFLGQRPQPPLRRGARWPRSPASRLLFVHELQEHPGAPARS